MNLRNAMKLLLVLVLGLPLVQAVFAWVIGLLGAMGDASAAAVLENINTALRASWLVCIVLLVVVIAMRNIEESKEE